MNRMIRLLAPLAALALLFAACGGDDDTESSADDPAENAGDVLDDSEDEAEDSAEDAIEGQLGGDCGFLGQFAGAGFEEALGVDPSSAFTDGGAGFEAIAEEFQEVADAAPDEIRNAFQKLAEGMDALAAALADFDPSDPESFDPSAFEALENEDFEQASSEVEDWVAEHCEGVTP